MDSHRRRRDLLALSVLLGIALVLRLFRLGEGLWFDEIWMLVDFARLPLGEIVTAYPSDNNHPLYTLLAAISIRVFGESAEAIRLPAVAFGVASIGALWVFARSRLPTRDVWIATSLLVISYHHVWFSQNARGYTGLLFLAIVSSHYFLRVLEGTGCRFGGRGGVLNQDVEDLPGVHETTAGSPPAHDRPPSREVDVALASAVSVGGSSRCLEGTTSLHPRLRRDVIIYAVTAGLSVYVHLTGVFMVFGHLVLGVWIWLRARQKSSHAPSAFSDAASSLGSHPTTAVALESNVDVDVVSREIGTERADRDASDDIKRGVGALSRHNESSTFPSSRAVAARIFAALGSATLVGFLLHVPLLADMFHFFFRRPERVAVESEWTSPWWTMTETARSLGLGTAVGLAILGIALFVFAVGLFDLRRRRPEIVLLFLVPVVTGAVVLLGLGRNLWPRFFFFEAGFGMLIAVRGVMVVADASWRVLRSKRAGIATRRVTTPTRTTTTIAPSTPTSEMDRPVAFPLSTNTVAAVAIFTIVAASLVILPRAWRPKQDFEAAVAHLDTLAPRPVITVGLADFPLRDYYGLVATSAESVADFHRLVPKAHSVWIVSTFPVFLRSRSPELADHIERQAVEIARFPGSVGGGDVVIFDYRIR